MSASVNEKLTALADEIRIRGGGEGKLTLDDMRDRILDVWCTGYDRGCWEGETDGYYNGYGEGYGAGYNDGIDVGRNEAIEEICPPFTESGSVVVCEPVVDYPIDVVSQIEGSASSVKLTQTGKNLINPSEYIQYSDKTTLDGDVFTSNFDNSALYINHGWSGKAKMFPKGTYTFSFIPVSEGAYCSVIIYSRATEAILFSKLVNASNSTMTFTANEEFRLSIGGPPSPYRGTHSFKLQLEVGAKASTYEPYRGSTFTFKLGETVSNASLNWATGVLTKEDGTTKQLTPQQIYGLEGTNTLLSSTGDTTVTGRADPIAIINKLTNSLGGDV